MLLQIHDELIFECSKDENEVKKIVKGNDIRLKFGSSHVFNTFEVNISSGNNWGEAH